MRRRLRLAVALALLAASLAGCSSRKPVLLADVGGAQDAGSRLGESYVQGVLALDLLFVIDDSEGMTPLQDALASGAAVLLARLAAAGVDFRIGITSTDLGIDPYGGPGCSLPGGGGGTLLNQPRVPGCAAPKERYLSATNSADPAAAFACIARLGEGGCGFERPVQAALRALTEPVPAANAGFLRGAASLVVVFLSNEDDCSAADPKLYDPDATSLGPWTSYRCFAQDIACTTTGPDGTLSGCSTGKGPLLLKTAAALASLSALKPSGVGLVAIAGPPSPVRVSGSGSEAKLEASCSSAGRSARPALRLHELVTLAGASGAFVSACASELGRELADSVLALATARSPGYCLRHALRDPARPGCSVEVVLPGGGSLSVPPSGSASPGFHLTHPLGGGCAHGALAFDPGATPPAGSTVHLRCDFVP